MERQGAKCSDYLGPRISSRCAPWGPKRSAHTGLAWGSFASLFKKLLRAKEALAVHWHEISRGLVSRHARTAYPEEDARITITEEAWFTITILRRRCWAATRLRFWATSHCPFSIHAASSANAARSVGGLNDSRQISELYARTGARFYGHA